MRNFGYLVVILATLWSTAQAFADGVSSVSEADRAASAGQVETVKTQNVGSPLIRKLLSDAADDVAAKRLLLPLHDNAVDKFRAVLMLEPENEVALTGLDNVVLSYAGLVRSHVANGRFTVAERLIQRVEDHFPSNDLVKVLRQEMAKAMEEKQPQDLSFVNDQEVQLFELPRVALSRKNESIKLLLTKIAKRVKETEEAVIILARSDAEGRWIYKTMKDAISGYRIRGDILRSKKPSIRLESPL